MHVAHSLKLQHSKVLRCRLSPRYTTQTPNASRICPMDKLGCADNRLLQGRIQSSNYSMTDRTAALSFQEKLEGCATVASGFLLAMLAAVSLALSPEIRTSLAASPTPVEVEAVKGIAINAWTIVRDTYVDVTFNHQNWEMTLQKALDEISTAVSKDQAYAKLQAMLATLEDPYTRIMPPKEFENFQISKDGSVEGVGLLLGSDQRSGRLFVLSPIKGGPAAKAGVMSGDELVQIDGEAIKGMNGEEAASRLRGRVGTSVMLGLHRQEVSINPAVGVPRSAVSEIKAGKMHAFLDKYTVTMNRECLNCWIMPFYFIQIKLLREKITLSPVSMAILPHTWPDGHASNTGYIHLSNFSESAAGEMENVIRDMEQKHVNSYILDLRDNPGGLVRVSIEVAEMWLDSNKTVVNTLDRDGSMKTIKLGRDSHPLTKDPLIVLLNGNSASASEIVAGALHDNGRALLLGQRSFGKGKIQSVTELEDGSGLFVTIAKYISPSLHDIDQRGITPDVQCSAVPAVDDYTEASVNRRDRVGKDPCVLAAQQQLLGALTPS